MKHHYRLYVWMKYDALCKMGVVCAESELHRILSRRNVKCYKLMNIDDDPMENWENSDWKDV